MQRSFNEGKHPMSHCQECADSPAACLIIIMLLYLGLNYEVILGCAEALLISLSTAFPFCSWLFKGRHLAFHHAFAFREN